MRRVRRPNIFQVLFGTLKFIAFWGCDSGADYIFIAAWTCVGLVYARVYAYPVVLGGNTRDGSRQIVVTSTAVGSV